MHTQICTFIHMTVCLCLKSWSAFFFAVCTKAQIWQSLMLPLFIVSVSVFDMTGGRIETGFCECVHVHARSHSPQTFSMDFFPVSQSNLNWLTLTRASPCL